MKFNNKQHSKPDRFNTPPMKRMPSYVRQRLAGPYNNTICFKYSPYWIVGNVNIPASRLLDMDNGSIAYFEPSISITATDGFNVRSGANCNQFGATVLGSKLRVISRSSTEARFVFFKETTFFMNKYKSNQQAR